MKMCKRVRSLGRLTYTPVPFQTLITLKIVTKRNCNTATFCWRANKWFDWVMLWTRSLEISRKGYHSFLRSINGGLCQSQYRSLCQSVLCSQWVTVWTYGILFSKVWVDHHSQYLHQDGLATARLYFSIKLLLTCISVDVRMYMTCVSFLHDNHFILTFPFQIVVLVVFIICAYSTVPYRYNIASSFLLSQKCWPRRFVHYSPDFFHFHTATLHHLSWAAPCISQLSPAHIQRLPTPPARI